jgi:hypothetical protein
MLFMTTVDDQPMCVVHVDEHHSLNFYLNGNAMFLIINERVTYDRVFQMTVQSPREVIEALIGSSEIRHCGDDRHAAVEHRIKRALERKAHLEIVKDDD